MDYEKLKEVIAKVIKENGQGDITGPALQMVLMAMVDSLGEVYPHTYTDEQKAQARANIDALSDHNGEITKEKLSTEVQAILDDVANKQNISDATLATIAKTIVGAINEVYKGGLKDASIATSKIEDGAITDAKIASGAVTTPKIANDAVTTEKVNDGAITEPKLDTDLTAKVNNNVKTVEQTLALNEIDTVLKNLKFRDTYGNFFADKVSYNSAFKEGAANGSIFGIFCRENTFGADCYANVCGNNFISNEIGAGCSGNIFGNDCRYNSLGGDCNNNTFGNGCKNNVLKGLCSNNVLGNGCEYNDLGVRATNVHLDSGVSYIELKSNASGSTKALQNIHILSGVRGLNSTYKLVINIPDEYLNSARELIITTKRTDGGPSTPEDIVMYYADEVQTKGDTTLETTSKEIVGAINELFNKVANLGPYTDNNKDLRSPNLPKGLWYMENLGGFTNVPSAFDINGPVILISTDNRIALFGCEKSSYGFSQYAWRERNTSYWLSGYRKYEEIFVKSENFLSDTEINAIWDNN